MHFSQTSCLIYIIFCWYHSNILVYIILQQHGLRWYEVYVDLKQYHGLINK